jgi:hypothetical protein
MASRWPDQRIYICQHDCEDYRTLDTDTRRQSKDGTAVLYSFLPRLQFLALAGSTDHSGSSSPCLESTGEGDILGMFDCMIRWEYCKKSEILRVYILAIGSSGRLACYMSGVD